MLTCRRVHTRCPLVVYFCVGERTARSMFPAQSINHRSGLCLSTYAPFAPLTLQVGTPDPHLNELSDMVRLRIKA